MASYNNPSLAGPGPRYGPAASRIDPVLEAQPRPPLADDSYHQYYPPLPVERRGPHLPRPVPGAAQLPPLHYASPYPPQGHAAAPYEHDSQLGPEYIGGPQDQTDPKRPRACDSCRGLKVRCDQDPDHPDRPCRRCARAKRPCIVTAPSRKRQKKTDNRVAELEKKIDALTATLEAQHKDTPSPAPSHSTASAPFSSPRSNNSSHKSWAHRESIDGAVNGSPRPPDARMRERSMDPTAQASAIMPARRAPSSPSKSQYDRHESGAGLHAPGRPPVQLPISPKPRKPYRLLSTDLDDSDAADDIPDSINEAVSEIIDHTTAASLFDRFVRELTPFLPIVVFPPDTTAADVRSSKPILFLSIINAASLGMIDPVSQDKLNRVLMRALAEYVVRYGEKSISLIQALLVAAVWYRQPKKYERMNFYQLGNMAAIMGVDIGLSKPSPSAKPARKRTSDDAVKDSDPMADLEQLEAKRTWLGCYFVSANHSTTLRRPHPVRWNSHMDECIDTLETSSYAAPLDKLLCQFVKLQHINEDVGSQFSMDDPSVLLSVSDARLHFTIKTFEGQLEDWNKGVPSEVWGPALRLAEQTSSLYMHEVALHSNHNVDDFRSPFTEDSVRTTGQSDVVSTAHSQALSDCVTSVRAMFRSFFEFSILEIKALPTFYFFRIAYAVVVLVKLYFAVTAPGSGIGKILTREQLQVENLVDRLRRLIETVEAQKALRPNVRFLNLLRKLDSWFRNGKVLPKGKGPAPPSEVKDTPPPAQTPPAHRGSVSTGRTPIYEASSPLHVLSDLAANRSTSAPYNQQASGPPMPHYAVGMHPQPQPGLPYPVSTGVQQSLHHAGAPDDAFMVSSGLDQAMDLTMGNGNPDFADVFNLFVNDPSFVGLGAEEPHGNAAYPVVW